MPRLTVRLGVFETNSSSTHSFTVCSKLDYDKWKLGLLKINRYTLDLKTDSEISKLREYDQEEYLLYDEFWEESSGMDTFHDEYEIEGVRLVAFGYYGYNG